MKEMELKVENKIEDEKVEELTKNVEAITDEKIEKSLNYDELTIEEKKAVDEFNEKIDVFDSTQILQYGALAQNKISEFSDSVLDGVKTKNTGDVGELLADLVSQIKSFDSSVDGNKKKGLFKIFSGFKKEVDVFEQYEIIKDSKIDKEIAKTGVVVYER